MILFIKHVDIEGPETLGTFFVEKGYELLVLDLHAGDHFPLSFDGIDAVVSLGGPMNVYETGTKSSISLGSQVNTENAVSAEDHLLLLASRREQSFLLLSVSRPTDRTISSSRRMPGANAVIKRTISLRWSLHLLLVYQQLGSGLPSSLR